MLLIYQVCGFFSPGLKGARVSVGKYNCCHCKGLFEVIHSIGLGKNQRAKCPACGSIDVQELPSWIPDGFNLGLYYSPSNWQYYCDQCQSTFELPVPSGPKEEQQRKCPTCGSMNLKRLTALVIEAPIYCS